MVVVASDQMLCFDDSVAFPIVCWLVSDVMNWLHSQIPSDVCLSEFLNPKRGSLFVL